MEDKRRILENEQKRIIEDIKQYEQQLSGHRLDSEICRCEVVRIEADEKSEADGEGDIFFCAKEELPKGEVYVAGSPKDLVEQLDRKGIKETADSLERKLKPDNNDDNGEVKTYKIRFISLKDTAERLKDEVELLKGQVKGDAQEIFGDQYKDENRFYKITVEGQAGNVECNLDSIEGILKTNKSDGDDDKIKRIIDNVMKGEKIDDEIDSLSFTLNNGEYNIYGEENELIGSVKKLGLREASKELEAQKDNIKVNIKENMGKLGLSDISDDMLDNLNDQPFHRFDHDGKVYVATPQASLADMVKQDFDDKRVKELKTLGDVNKALEDGIHSLEKCKQNAAKAIFGSGDAFSLRIAASPSQSGDGGSATPKSDNSGIKDIGDGFIEYCNDSGEVIRCYRNFAAFKNKYNEIFMEDESGEWIECSKGENIEKRIKGGEEFKFSKDETVELTRYDLYKETKDIEGCWKKLSEEVNKCYKDLTGVDIKPDANGTLQLYAHKFNEKVYITTEQELKENDLRKARNQCRSDPNREDYVKEADIAKWGDNANVEAVGLSDAYQKLKNLSEPKQDLNSEGGKENDGGKKDDGDGGKKADGGKGGEGDKKIDEDPKIGKMKKDHQEIFGEELKSGYMLSVGDGAQDDNNVKKLREILGMGTDVNTKFFTADQLAKLAEKYKEKPGFSQLSSELAKLNDTTKSCNLTLYEQKVGIEHLGLEETHKKMVEAAIMELYAMDKINYESFYAYEVKEPEENKGTLGYLQKQVRRIAKLR